MSNARDKINFDDGIEYTVPAERRSPGGVSIRKDPETGADVFMYKRKPGIYYSTHGLEVSVTMAQRAGFDTERDLAARQRMTKMVEFEQNWRAQNVGSEARIVAERGGYRLEERPGLGYYVIHVETGTRVTREHTAPTEQMGLDWLSDFAGPAEKTFDGTPESVRVADGNVQRTGDTGGSGTDRRTGSDAKPTGVVRKPVNS